MDLGKAIKGGKAVYANGEHEAVVNFNGVTPNGKNAFDVHEHTKGVGHVTGVCLNAREAVETLQQRGVPTDCGWIDETKK
ncbi:MAG TPA: hypothetical protein VGL94_08085 [Ktedonobacteraceae bacterium]|jgi:hypothetical protein